MQNLLIEIGNTAVKAAWAEGTVLGKIYRYQGERALEFICSITEKQSPFVMSVISVRAISKEEESVLEGLCQRLLLYDISRPGALSAYDIPEYLTFDRAASLVAARYLFKGKSCTVFDFGSTLTVDFMDEDGRYCGGTISPGCRTRFKALNRYSRALPLVDMPKGIKFPPSSVEESIAAGVINGMVFEIEGYVRQNPENVLIFTGGDAIYFANRMKNPIFAVCNLSLMGLAIITDDYVGKNII